MTELLGSNLLAYRMADPLMQYYLYALLSLYPARRILQRAGLPATGVFLLLLPWVGFVALALRLAFGKWTRVAPLKQKREDAA
jgi:hypothetical protein